MADQKSHRLAVIAPVLRVSDLKRSHAFYCEKLKFESGFEWSDSADEPVRYAILHKDQVELHLSQTENPVASAVYVFVEGVNEYYRLVSSNDPKLAGQLKDWPWDMREFAVRDPDGNELIFGEHLDRISNLDADNRD